MKKLMIISGLCVLSMCAWLSSCTTEEPDNGGKTGTDTTTNTGDDDNDFVEKQTWKSTIGIVWNGSSASVTGSADGVTVSIEGGVVTVKSSAKHVAYEISGSGTGQLNIYSDYKFKLALNGVTLSSSDGPAVNSQCKKTCYVVLSGSNSLTDGSVYASSTEDRKAAFFSEGQLVFSGTGQLSVTGNSKHAMASDDYVRVREGVIILTAKVSDGLHANDGIIIDGGSLDISAAGDGVQCDTSSIVVSGGSVTVSAAGDKGMLAYTSIVISGGTVDVTSVDKGIKSAAGDIVISGGNVIVTTTGDDGKGILARLGGVVISDGTVSVLTKGSTAKGIKSAGDLTISGGDICVVCSGSSSSGRYAPPGGGPGGGPGGSSGPEGIESKGAMVISGGKVFAQSSDDAINSAGNMTISGGYVCAYSTGNDGLDANGNCYISGGVVYAIGSSSPEVGIDANTEGGKKLYVSGGTIVAIGGLENGSSLTQSCYSSSSWSKSIWYALYQGTDAVLAFKTPVSGGSRLVVSASSTPTLKSGVSVSDGTAVFNGMGYTSPTVSGGSNVSLSAYTGGNGRW